MRLLGCTRVSTATQDAQLQLDALVDVGVQKRDVFADVTSGRRTAIERRGMKRLLEHAEAGDTVVVGCVDRLGRSLIDVLNTVNLLRERGINVRSVSDGIDPATSTGRLMLNMLATLAEYERELIVERVNAGIAVARQTARRSAGPSTILSRSQRSSRSWPMRASEDGLLRKQLASLVGAVPRPTAISEPAHRASESSS